jgi:hypothetical protein
MTDTEKIATVEHALDGTLTLETVKLALGIDHADSDTALQLLITSFNLGHHARWNL